MANHSEADRFDGIYIRILLEEVKSVRKDGFIVDLDKLLRNLGSYSCACASGED